MCHKTRCPIRRRQCSLDTGDNSASPFIRITQSLRKTINGQAVQVLRVRRVALVLPEVLVQRVRPERLEALALPEVPVVLLAVVPLAREAVALPQPLP